MPIQAIPTRSDVSAAENHEEAVKAKHKTCTVIYGSTFSYITTGIKLVIEYPFLSKIPPPLKVFFKPVFILVFQRLGFDFLKN